MDLQYIATIFIQRRMKDLGIGDNYYLRVKQVVMQPNETRTLDSDNQLYFLIEEIAQITIASDFGLYDLSDLTLNEQAYEHEGTIQITNNAPTITRIRFIQAIIKN